MRIIPLLLPIASLTACVAPPAPDPSTAILAAARAYCSQAAVDRIAIAARLRGDAVLTDFGVRCPGDGKAVMLAGDNL